MIGPCQSCGAPLHDGACSVVDLNIENAALNARIAELEARLADETDPTWKERYRQVCAAMDERVHALNRIGEALTAAGVHEDSYTECIAILAGQRDAATARAEKAETARDEWKASRIETARQRDRFGGELIAERKRAEKAEAELAAATARADQLLALIREWVEADNALAGACQAAPATDETIKATASARRRWEAADAAIHSATGPLRTEAAPISEMGPRIGVDGSELLKGAAA